MRSHALLPADPAPNSVLADKDQWLAGLMKRPKHPKVRSVTQDFTTHRPYSGSDQQGRLFDV